MDTVAKIETARNPNTPPHVLARLADDPDSQVLSWVARNPNTPRHVLERLAGGPEVVARFFDGLAREGSTPDTP